MVSSHVAEISTPVAKATANRRLGMPSGLCSHKMWMKIPVAS